MRPSHGGAPVLRPPTAMSVGGLVQLGGWPVYEGPYVHMPVNTSVVFTERLPAVPVVPVAELGSLSNVITPKRIKLLIDVIAPSPNCGKPGIEPCDVCVQDAPVPYAAVTRLPDGQGNRSALPPRPLPDGPYAVPLGQPGRPPGPTTHACAGDVDVSCATSRWNGSS